MVIFLPFYHFFIPPQSRTIILNPLQNNVPGLGIWHEYIPREPCETWTALLIITNNLNTVAMELTVLNSKELLRRASVYQAWWLLLQPPSAQMCAYLMCLVQTLIMGISWSRLPSPALFTAPKMQMLVINPTPVHLFGVIAPCFIKPIYHFGLLNQWDAEKSRVSTEARGENTTSSYKSEQGSTEAGIDQNICHTLWTCGDRANSRVYSYIKKYTIYIKMHYF